jgi:hypothetical protein
MGQEPIGYADVCDLEDQGMDFYVNRQRGKRAVPVYLAPPSKPWDTNDMAHRSGGLSVEQAEKQEPVAWMTNSEQDVTAEFLFSHVQTQMHKIPLYESPPKREQDNPKLQLDAIERAYFHGKQQGIAESEAIKRQWVGLTDDDKELLVLLWAPPIHPDFKDDDDFDDLLKNVEAKLRERNT